MVINCNSSWSSLSPRPLVQPLKGISFILRDIFVPVLFSWLVNSAVRRSGASLSRSNNRSSSALPLPPSWHLCLHIHGWAPPLQTGLWFQSYSTTFKPGNKSPWYTVFPSPSSSFSSRWIQRPFQRWAVCMWIVISEDTSLQLSSAWGFCEKTRSRAVANTSGFEWCSGMLFEKRNASIAWMGYTHLDGDSIPSPRGIEERRCDQKRTNEVLGYGRCKHG